MAIIPNNNPQNPVASYSKLSELLYGIPNVTGLYYNGTTIRLDGYKFTRCRFDGCTIEVMSDNFELEECIIDPSCKIVFANSPTKIIKLFNRAYDWAEKYFGKDFVPIKNPNGSITIKG